MKDIQKKVLIFILFLSASSAVFAGTKKINVSCSENDAEIFANGQLMGKGKALIVMPAYTDVTVECVKVGFLTEKMQFYNKPNNPEPPKTYHFKMRVDDAYEASTKTDVANLDLELKTTKNEDDAWLLINRVILSYGVVLSCRNKINVTLITNF